MDEGGEWGHGGVWGGKQWAGKVDKGIVEEPQQTEWCDGWLATQVSGQFIHDDALHAAHITG